MAKQSGLHQIRGKVGEHSYYKQSGVASGLIRSINQGMSARVKTGAEYANTRLNNQEFGAAADTAALLGKMVVPKFRPMILPFSQSRMSKEILKVARQHDENWGQRVVTSGDTAQLCAILSAQSKRAFDEFVSVDITRSSVSEATASVVYTAAQASLMTSLGITDLTVVATQFDLATGQWVPLAQVMSTGYMQTNSSVPVLEESQIGSSGESNSEDFTVSEFIPEANHSGHQIVVFVVMPLRKVSEGMHILQEYCSFVALPLPAAE